MQNWFSAIGADSGEEVSKIQTIADELRIADELFDGRTRRVRSDSQLQHRPVGSVGECGGLEDPPFARTIGIASHLVPGHPRRAGDRLRGQVSSGAVLLGSLSKRDLHFFKELFPLRLRKTNDQPSQALRG
jgi:hypothetical protein